jgi:hypothetical protein
VRTVENNFSLKRDAYRIACQPRWVPGDKLTEAAWLYEASMPELDDER